MLSNQTTNLHNRQRQHRRQNSTPSVFEPVKVSSLPNIQRNHGHRRGMSLDHRSQQTPPKDRMVSNLNTGYPTAPQHFLQEAQQHGLVRPGQQYTKFGNDGNYLSSPVVTPHRSSLDMNYTPSFEGNMQQSPHHFAYLGPMSWAMGVEQTNTCGNNDFNLLPNGPNHSINFLEFSSSHGSSIGSSVQENFDRRGSTGGRISDGISERVSQFENLALQSPHRPLTPSNNELCAYFPPTPTDTPHLSMIKQGSTNARFMDDYDTSMEETIKPSNNQRARGVFDDMRKELEVNSQSSLPDSSPVTEPFSFESGYAPTNNLINPSNMDYDLPNNESQLNSDPLFSPDSTEISSLLSGYQSSREDYHCHALSDSFLNSINISNQQNDLEKYTKPKAQTPLTTQSPKYKASHRRFDSTSTINIEESITETGITVDEIASFISGPDPVDGGKWLCMYPNCRKRFGRKENIKSHVQTHLGDRQFQCPFCKKCFVRQHDLKRHAKIHSGVKPYPCQCGNSFARHDALTRHRQRGMCIGAFEGIVKKAAKRGRPRKNRPEDDKKDDHSPKSYRKNHRSSISSSISRCSESRDQSSRSNSRELPDLKQGGRFDYHQSPLDANSLDLQQIQPQLSLNNQLLSRISDTQPPTNLGGCQTSNSGPISKTIPEPEAIQISKFVHQTNGYHSSPQLYESISSPESLSNYFDLDQPQTSSEMHLSVSNVPTLGIQDDNLYHDVFSTSSQNHNMTNLGHENDYLMNKIADSYGQTIDEDLFPNSQYVFFGSP
ncbi:putative c2h2 transcription factor swi5 [Golovinomyces cichoracearum]|uniref:Putative c2h2 transcription factor swi5 n=1 Tax=Golovinomyces cichoracearum TaxID=62708 RepID=A0A420IE89_9PEZI|nr:putative c2h2 transcription factor swi5 [Golovinomyces cichoracearum]